MNKAELERILEEQATQNHKSLLFGFDKDKLRLALNWLFLVLGVVGVVIYYFHNHAIGLIVVGVSLAFKVVEFLIRCLL